MIQKKIKSLIYAGLGLVLCVLLCGGIGMTSQAESYGNLTYEENESGITITRYTGNKTKLVIPGKIGGKKVTSIGWNAFLGCRGLKSITLPEGVTSIRESAFRDCSGLTCITIPEGVTGIESEVFEGCSGLKNITLPKEVTSIGEFAFMGCSGLKSITLPKSVTSIGLGAFGDCSGLKSITIPKSVTSIDYDVFRGCDSLAISCYKNFAVHKYAIENNIPVKLIGKNATPASGTPAKKGTTLTISSKKLQVKVTSSSKKNPTVTITKFTDKKAKKLTIPATVKVKGVTYKVTAVSDKAFKGSKKLTTVTIGSNVTKIGKEASSGCKNLKKITVTAGKLKTISKNAFKGINKKATITVKGTKKAKTALKKQLKKKSVGYVKTWKIK